MCLAAGLPSGCGSKVTTLSCVPACPPGFSCSERGCVPDTPSSGACDGGCDLALPVSTGCQPSCAFPTPVCNDSGVCVPCLVDGDCLAGQSCRPSGSVTACVTVCESDVTCLRLGATEACCDGACVDTLSDAKNCGGCGAPCVVPHAAAGCSAGQCQTGSCNPNWGDCNSDPQDGCETNLLLDTRNCGSCGTTCSLDHARAACSGACYVAACDFGWGDCDGLSPNGCEQAVIADIENCGACGNSCPAQPHSSPACDNGTCQIARCSVGYADCDGNPGNGCEVPVGTDPANCGTCGHACGNLQVCRNGGCTCPACSFPNARSTCVNNVCALGACVPGFGNCNGVDKDGCEADLGSDGNNCNGCGLACPPNAMNCIDGVCSAGFTHHDGLGETWIDPAPNKTYTVDEASAACNAYVTQRLGGMDVCVAVGCGCGGMDLCVYNQNANPRYTWFYNNGGMGGQVTLNCCGCGPVGIWD